MSTISTCPPDSQHCKAVRTAISILCEQMLRAEESTGLGTRESEEIEVRMGALVQIQRESEELGQEVSMNRGTTHLGASGTGTVVSAREERERDEFTQALRDGYVLCQLMNKLRPGSIEWIDPREDGVLRTSNVTKFLEACFARELPTEDVFLHDDLINATTDALARVATTITTLVKWSEAPPPTNSLCLETGGNSKPDDPTPGRIPAIPSRVTANATDSPSMMSVVLSVDGTITTPWTRNSSSSPPTRNSSSSPPTRDRSMTPSTKNQSISPSIKSSPISPSIKNVPISPLTKNQAISPSPDNPSISSSAKNQTIPPSPKNHSTSPLARNQTTSPSPKNMFGSLYMTARHVPDSPSGHWTIPLPRTNQPITPSIININNIHSNALGISYGDEYNAGDKSGVERGLRLVSDRRERANDFVMRDVTERSVSQQRLVMGEEGKSWSQFQFGNRIGRGPCASVYRAINLNTRQIVAVKQIELEGFEEEEVVQLIHEVERVKQLSHPNIIKYEGMTRNKNILSIVLEYAENGSLKQMLQEFGELSEELAAGYVVKVLSGLDYLHHSDIVHGDLKAANVLVTKNGDVKLSDFVVSLDQGTLEYGIKTISYPPNWAAPEVIKLKSATKKSDVWSLGCTVIELLTGQPPYSEIAHAPSVMFRIVEDDSPPIPERLSDLLVAFLKDCFRKVPSQRPSAKELSQYEWLNLNLNKETQLRERTLCLPTVNDENDPGCHLEANFDLANPESAPRPARMVWWHRIRKVFTHLPSRAHRRSISALPEVDLDVPGVRGEHTFVEVILSKPVGCRVCATSLMESAILCSHCYLVAHTECAARARAGCDPHVRPV